MSETNIQWESGNEVHSGNLVTWYTVEIWSRGTQWEYGNMILIYYYS
jgi:hypothetical protein